MARSKGEKPGAHMPSPKRSYVPQRTCRKERECAHLGENMAVRYTFSVPNKESRQPISDVAGLPRRFGYKKKLANPKHDKESNNSGCKTVTEITKCNAGLHFEPET